MPSDDRWLHSTRPAPRAEYGIMCKDPRPGCWSKHYHRIVPREVADAIWLVETALLGEVALSGGWYRDLAAVEHPGDHSQIDLLLINPDPENVDDWMEGHPLVEPIETWSSGYRECMIGGIKVAITMVVTPSEEPF